jgi:hypothetical protein
MMLLPLAGSTRACEPDAPNSCKSKPCCAHSGCCAQQKCRCGDEPYDGDNKCCCHSECKCPNCSCAKCPGRADEGAGLPGFVFSGLVMMFGPSTTYTESPATAPPAPRVVCSCPAAKETVACTAAMPEPMPLPPPVAMVPPMPLPSPVAMALQCVPGMPVAYVPCPAAPNAKKFKVEMKVIGPGNEPYRNTYTIVEIPPVNYAFAAPPACPMHPMPVGCGPMGCIGYPVGCAMPVPPVGVPGCCPPPSPASPFVVCPPCPPGMPCTPGAVCCPAPVAQAPMTPQFVSAPTCPKGHCGSCFRVVEEDGHSYLEMKVDGGTITCRRLTLQTSGAPLAVHAGKSYVHVAGDAWKATADMVEVSPGGQAVVMTGHVRLVSGKAAAVVKGEQVSVRLNDQHVETKLSDK